jgi:DNA-binding IscR family transcriptional regulator
MPSAQGTETRQGLKNMPEGLSMYAEKVYNAMKNAELDSEERMANAERIVGLTKAPKNFVLRALDELQSKGLVKRKAREKAAGYYLLQKQ